MGINTPEHNTPTHLGQIVRLNYGGLAYLHDEHCQRQHGFTFDKIVGYRGQYPHELTDFSKKGLREGVIVQFTLDAEDKISRVYPRDVKKYNSIFFTPYFILEILNW